MTNFLALQCMGSGPIELVYLQGGLVKSSAISLPVNQANIDTWTPNRVVKIIEPTGSSLFITCGNGTGGGPAGSLWASFDEGATWTVQYKNSTLPFTFAIGDGQGEMIHVMGSDDTPYVVINGWDSGGVAVTPVYNDSFAAGATITTVTAASYTDGQTFQLTDIYGSSEIFEFDKVGGVTPGNVAVDISAAVSNSDVRDAIISAVNGTSLEITASNGGTSTVTLTQNIGGARGNGTIPTTGSPPGTYNRFFGGGWVNRPSALGAINVPIIKFPYKGSVFYVDNNLALHSYRYDPALNTATALIIPGTNIKDCGAMFTLDQRLFLAVGVNSPATGTRLYEYQYGTWVLVQEVWVSYLANGTTEGGGSARMAAIHLPGDRVLLLASGNNGLGFGLEAVLVTLVAGVPTPTRKTTVTVPAALQGPAVTGDPDAYSVLATTDNQDTPGSPKIYVWFHPTGLTNTATINLFELDYSDPDNPVLVDLGATDVNAQYSLAVTPSWGGGECLWTPGELAITVTYAEADAQGYRLKYRCSGDPGNANKTVSFRFITGFGVPVNTCTLVSGSAIGGGTVSGNTIINVDADPTITHEVVWDFITDGQLNLDQCNLQGFLS